VTPARRTVGDSNDIEQEAAVARTTAGNPHDGLGKRSFMTFTSWLDRRYGWSHLPKPIALVTLIGLRMVLRRHNLFDVHGVTLPWGPEPLPKGKRNLNRTTDGTGNDLTREAMGSVGQSFGRNVPLTATAPQDVLEPNPRTISLELLGRKEFIPATTLNVLAAAWIQFEVHDWFSHGDNLTTNHWKVDLAPDDPFPDHPMLIERTRSEPPVTEGIAETFKDSETHWWDASQVYGSTPEMEKLIRTNVGGKLKLAPNGLVPFDPTTLNLPGMDLAAVHGNWWVGLAMLHTLFMQEHNTICDLLAPDHPEWNDQQLFAHARLINAALIAKIHTVEWTPALLADSVMQTGMRANWWGLMGERFTKRFGRISSSEEVSGIPGSRTYHHGAPYAMTEEFVSVYRMHPLMPDDFKFRATVDDKLLMERDFQGAAGVRTHEVLEAVSMTDLFYSLGTANPGAIVLHNYPQHLQHFERPDGTVIDLGAIDILRSRERGVPRYNEFRRSFHLAPVERFEDFSSDPEIVAELRRIYKDPEDVDVMVGLYAEHVPGGFAFSDTAFRVFVLMASRRLKSDRFFTYDYRAEVYTKEGIRWIEENSMLTVIARHFPELSTALKGIDNAFTPWVSSAPSAKS